MDKTKIIVIKNIRFEGVEIKMKSKKYTSIGIFTIIFMVVLIICVYYKVTTTIQINKEDVERIIVCGIGGRIDTTDKNKIEKAVKHINSIRYYKAENSQATSNSLDAFIKCFDKSGKLIVNIDYFGDVVMCNGSVYGKLPLELQTYSGLEELCKDLNKK